ncbi:MAG: type I 3-dehydroquinate dehydratase [Prevotellaceae bacterium]|jgi:3-dehydroquinate dehydratase type I|nr:type I 3-dehydroquinate dehydratase [Prevotellaceae bacterium]
MTNLIKNSIKTVAPVCVSVGEKSYKDILCVLDKTDFAEIRLDISQISDLEAASVFACGKELIATCREGFYDREARLGKLLNAIRSGAKFVDVETETDRDFKETVAKEISKNDCKLIISYHNFQHTPSLDEMLKIIDTCTQQGADIVKLVTTANSKADAARALSLYDNVSPHTNLVAFAMGEAGLITRAACVFLGAPYTYAAISDDKPLANGQLSLNKMKAILDSFGFKNQR